MGSMGEKETVTTDYCEKHGEQNCWNLGLEKGKLRADYGVALSRGEQVGDPAGVTACRSTCCQTWIGGA